ncbi:prostaglandin E receptor 4 [Mytilus galloprovincialis]|uniref:Thromboxane A2 receptor n=1 Tax=Mytilus galloprovincialis TaxID=29158 RepID=A0A8B6GMU3_MYTGA|nr:prostaglandin E receptor 4 [Mytilus galloprovincialis]VDI66145.1 prostaglandin E receptor 4 [Mytilus galloprovincialis]
MENYSFFDPVIQFNNGTVDEEQRPMVSSLVPSIMFAAGVFGNLLALFVLSRSPKEQRRSVFYRLVAALAFTDLFGTLTTSPVTLLVYNNNLKWLGGQPLCDYFSIMLIFAGLATVFTLGAMALDRFMALKHPYIYHAKIKYKQATYIVLTLWLVAIMIALLPKIGLGKNVKQFPGSWCFFEMYGDTASEKAFAILFSILGISIIFTIAVLNIILISTLCNMRKKAPRSLNARNIIQCEVQMAIFLVGVMMVFSVCYAPLMIRVLVIQTGLTGRNNLFDLTVIRLASFNQILDPWVYLLFRRELVVRGISIIQKHFCPKTFKKKKNNSSFKYIERTMTTEKMVTVAQTSDIPVSPITPPPLLSLLEKNSSFDQCPA